MVLSGGVLWWARILAGLAFVALAVVIWRVWALAIYAGPHDLVIRNFRNAHRIPWSDIEDICVTPPIPVAVYRENPLATQDVSLLVRLKEGAIISATLYDDRMFNSRRYRRGAQARKQAVEQLNDLWRERSGLASRK
jgi:hypothetical protein